jgi:hypothetical protein
MYRAEKRQKKRDDKYALEFKKADFDKAVKQIKFESEVKAV